MSDRIQTDHGLPFMKGFYGSSVAFLGLDCRGRKRWAIGIREGKASAAQLPDPEQLGGSLALPGQ